MTNLWAHSVCMKNILVPTDFSENSKNALKYSQILFNSLECNFYILFVGTLLDSQTNSFGVLPKLNNDEPKEDAKERLADLVDGFKKQNTNGKHHFYPLLEFGFFVPTIRKQLEEKDIELIVMGTKGASGLKEKVVGSNAGDVITKVQCNTLVIPNDVEFHLPQEIAFPTDFNIFYSHYILRSIEEMLEVGSGKLRIMNAIRNGDGLSIEQETNKEYLFDYLEESFQERFSFHTVTNKNVKSAIQCFVESRDVEMIIMVAKNLNFIEQILFDPIVEKISFHTKIPFYVIHE
ncbi:universal stress protein [Flagellimonas nanhaiensis]|uniref:Universal stress protein n=2 Tax=Flagellimonas nanhaiensis TaxID=2292706 RepID=A0A371JLT9_9FLAO|nr:universal stress protein [Allomuricauda nanhaiensis]